MKKSNSRTSNIIAIVTPAIASEGITKLVATQIKILQEDGYSVYLVILSDFNIELFDSLDIKLEQKSILLLNQVDTYLSIRNLASSFTTLVPIINFFKDNRIRLVIGHGPYAHFILRLVKCTSFFTSSKVKLIQFFHIDQYQQFPLNSFRRLVMNIINKWLARLYDDAHVFVSNAVKEDVQRHLISHGNCTVLYNPLSDYWSTLYSQPKEITSLPEKPLSRFSILLSNRVEPSKGQMFFINVVEEFVNSFQLTPIDFQLVITGDGVQRQELLDKVRDSNLSAFVQYLGLLSIDELSLELTKTDLVVVPSMHEGFSFTALEALGAGCLVLASNAGGLNEVIKDGETGFLFEKGDSKDCLNKLSYIYKNRFVTLIYQKNVGKDLENRFSVQSYKEKLMNVVKLR